MLADLPPGSRVALLCGPCPEAVALLDACLRRRLTLVPLNHRLSAPELAAVFKDADAALLVASAPFLAQASALGGAAALERLRLDGEGLEGDPEDIALILYTSGTTGLPKGAMLSRRMLEANCRHTVASWGLTAADSTVTFAPFFHTGGWNVLTLPLLSVGGRVTYLDKFDAPRVNAALLAGEATVFFGVPTMFQLMLEAGLGRAPASVRFLISGGAPCPEPLMERYEALGYDFRQGFGMTEAGPNCFRGGTEGSVGRPAAGTRMRLGDDGELWISGAHLFSGYWRNEAETAKTLVDGWVRTGDIAGRDADGSYRILGRRKEMYISGGENVYPAEVERVLLAHPAVAEAAVIGVPDPKWQEAGRAFIVLRPGARCEPSELLDFCRAHLAGYKRPKTVALVGALPKNAMGKVQKKALAALGAGPMD